MAVSQMMQLAFKGDLAAFESHMLDLLNNGDFSPLDVVEPLLHVERSGQASKLSGLAQLLLENQRIAADPAGALAATRIALLAAPERADLRQKVAALFEQVHGALPGFSQIIDASGLTGTRPPRAALKFIDLCLHLKKGDTFISRMEGRIVEVTDVIHEELLITLRRDGRPTTMPIADVVREFDPINPEDVRALRQLRPQRLIELLENEPIRVVCEFLQHHGYTMTLDQLKDEICPRFVPEDEWSKWWTKVRTLAKRSPNLQIEGRAPVILKFDPKGQTLEDEIWAEFDGKDDAAKWLAIVESYMREKTARSEPIDSELLQRFHDQILTYAQRAQAKRPAEALACGLVLLKLSGHGLPITAESGELAPNLLKQSKTPTKLVSGFSQDALLMPAVALLREVREEWPDCYVELLPLVGASLLDVLTGALVEIGRAAHVQKFIDDALATPSRYPEALYWLWKGPKHTQGLNVPTPPELFTLIINQLSALGRTIQADASVVREFRARMKSALGLRDYTKVRDCLKQVSEAAAITFRRHFDRLEGLGDNIRAKLLDLLRDVHPQLWIEKRARISAWEDKNTIYTTAEGLRRKTAERDELVNVTIRENEKRIGEAASLGDLSENSEYKFALEERDLLRARLALMNQELSMARLLTADDVPADMVGVGTRVRFRVAGEGERTLTFLGPFEANAERGIYSYLAPLSQRMMGLTLGSQVKLMLDGREAEIEILAVENAVERTPLEYAPPA